MANWIGNLSIFAGAVTLGWFATQFIDWLLQTPMVPSEEHRTNRKRLETLFKRVEKHLQNFKTGQTPSIPDRKTFAHAWRSVLEPLASVQGLAYELRERHYPNLPSDVSKDAAARILADIQAPITVLASGAPLSDPSDSFDGQRAFAHWLVVALDLDSVNWRLRSFLEELPEYHGFKVRGWDLYKALEKIRKVGKELVYGG